jgi:hypothetical protein
MEKLTLDLCMFDDGGGADGGATAAAAEATPAAEVILGKPAPDQRPSVQQEEPKQHSPTPPDRAKAFDELIKGEYKEEYAQRTQKMIDSRFKAAKATEARMNALQPVLESLSTRYGLDMTAADFAQQLQGKLDADTGWLEDEADRRGMTVEQLRQEHATNAELTALRAFRATMEAQQRTDQIVAGWQDEAAQLKQLYPGFDLAAEIADDSPTRERFISLLQAPNVTMRDVYEIIHKDELLGGAIKHAVQTTQQRTMDNIRARGMRPSEAAAGSQTKATQVRNADPSTWTPEQMAEALRQAREGKKIYL